MWQIANNGRGKRHWFLYRDNADGTTDYHFSAADSLVWYLSAESAQRAADRLNAEA